MPQPAVRTSNPHLSRARVLLVDADAKQVERNRAALQATGADVQTADDGAYALNLVDIANDADTPFDIVVLDLDLPYLSGPEAATSIRSDLDWTPLVALSSQPVENSAATTLLAGFDAILPKPVRGADLVGTCERLLAARAKNARHSA